MRLKDSWKPSSGQAGLCGSTRGQLCPLQPPPTRGSHTKGTQSRGHKGSPRIHFQRHVLGCLHNRRCNDSADMEWHWKTSVIGLGNFFLCLKENEVFYYEYFSWQVPTFLWAWQCLVKAQHFQSDVFNLKSNVFHFLLPDKKKEFCQEERLM